jgi:phosphoribosylanthranilate isomerase
MTHSRGFRPLPVPAHGVAVKICGLTRPEDAAVAGRLGAAALGVVLAPSPRRVALDRAAEVLAAAPPGVARVGVFVGAGAEEIGEAVERCGLDWVQLSGGMGREQRAGGAGGDGAGVGAGAALGVGVGVGVIRAVHVQGPGDLVGVAGDSADAFLLDAPVRDGQMGGTGRQFDWTAAMALPWERSRLIVAGGLRADNVSGAIAALRPAMVDVSSGVEAAPGIKDAGRMEAFMEAVRRAGIEEVECH